MRHHLLIAALVVAAGTAGAQSDDQPSSGADSMPPGAQAMEGFSEIPFDELTADDLEGVILFGAEGAEIGAVSTVVPTEEPPGDVLVDVGDLVNLGELALAFQPVDLVALRSEQGELRLVSRMTRADIEAVAASSSN